MFSERKTNKKLVKLLMDKKGIDIITITKDKVLVEVNEKFTPEMGLSLVKEIGHTTYQPVSRGGKNYLLLDRF